MLIYILKFSACLAILMVFYKSVLERLSTHWFKRFYLLAALLLALFIPTLTFVEYIDPVVLSLDGLEPIPAIDTINASVEETTTDYTSILLWSIMVWVYLFLLLNFGSTYT